MSVNTPYWILLRNPMCSDQILNFAKQHFTGRVQPFLETYHKVTREPYSYILLDFHPRGNPQFSVRTNIFKDQDPIIYTFP